MAQGHPCLVVHSVGIQRFAGFVVVNGCLYLGEMKSVPYLGGVMVVGCNALRKCSNSRSSHEQSSHAAVGGL